MTLKLEGIICPVVTPFTRDDEIDHEFFCHHLDWLIERKISAIVTSGSTGEFPCLSKSERDELISLAKERTRGKVGVIAGTGSASIRETIQLTMSAEKLDADAAMVITPYYFKSSGDALYQYFKTIAKETKLPIIPYNNPGRTGVNITPEVVCRLAQDGLIAGYKDSGGNMIDTMEVISAVGDRISVIQGRDSLALPTYLMGGKGVISACSNVVPVPIVSLYGQFTRNDLAKAREIQRKISVFDKLAVTSENYPEALKVAMEIAGMSCGHARSVHATVGEQVRNQIKSSLQDLKVL